MKDIEELKKRLTVEGLAYAAADFVESYPDESIAQLAQRLVDRASASKLEMHDEASLY